MQEYRVDIKVRNNVILKKMESAGYKTASEFCRLNNISGMYGILVKIINMQISPLKKNGEFLNAIIKTADALMCSPEDLFTDVQLRTVLATNKRSLEVNEAEMKFLCDTKQKTFEQINEHDQLSHLLNDRLSLLSMREQDVIKMRFGIDGYDEHIQEQIAEKYEITKSRVAQIEAKALRKLRHPDRSESLKDYHTY